VLAALAVLAVLVTLLAPRLLPGLQQVKVREYRRAAREIKVGRPAK